MVGSNRIVKPPGAANLSPYVKPHLIECECQLIAPTVGYYYKFYLPEIYPTSNFVGDPLVQQPFMAPPAINQFNFSLEHSAYYMSNTDIAAAVLYSRSISNRNGNLGSPLAKITRKTDQKWDNEKSSPVADEAKEDNMSLFYSRLVWMLEKFSSAPGVLTLLDSVHTFSNAEVKQKAQ